jgi:hypothetical protein
LAVSGGLGIFTIYSSDELPFDCSTLEYCSLTLVNTLLAFIVWFGGTAGLAIFGSISAFVYAFPAVMLAGYAMAMAENSHPEKRPTPYWLLAGALLGTLWWRLLWHLQWLPDVLQIHRDEAIRFSSSPDVSLTIASAFGGMMAAWMFRVWWRSETRHLIDAQE